MTLKTTKEHREWVLSLALALEFARQLERELTALKAENELMRPVVEAAIGWRNDCAQGYNLLLATEEYIVYLRVRGGE